MIEPANDYRDYTVSAEVVYGVEVWTFPTEGDEEPCVQEMIEFKDFDDEKDAMRWAWDRLEEGFYVRMFRR